VPDPVCGNGKREGDEQCDDAGHDGQDGCDAQCQVVCSDFDDDAEASADHHCYAGYDQADFEGAQKACQERGAHLVTISSAAENELVDGFVNNSKFIGTFEDVELTSESHGTYQWITGETMAFQNWSGGQPDRAGARCNEFANNARCYEHCAFMLGNGTWADQRCDLVDGYVCEWEPAGD
jgi:cysteine-rich repeat protein